MHPVAQPSDEEGSQSLPLPDQNRPNTKPKKKEKTKEKQKLYNAPVAQPPDEEASQSSL
jgi:hypothetical protein